LEPSLTALVALQALDSAADAARRRLAELPAAEQALAARVAEATELVNAAKAVLAENQTLRRQLEKDVAAVDARLTRFDSHKAAIKTNVEYTALLHEIATAKEEKDGVEERILIQMEAADGLTRELKSAEAALAKTRQEGDAARAAFATERRALEAEIARLAAARKGATTGIEARPLALYEQLLKGRRGVAVASMTKDTCNACHVRLRPHIEQQVRRNDSIVQCDSCQRILYYAPPPAAPEASAAPPVEPPPAAKRTRRSASAEGA
jgi:predicted  nucleic acid-binding Zn-ribbon protein